MKSQRRWVVGVCFAWAATGPTDPVNTVVLDEFVSLAVCTGRDFVPVEV